MAYPKYDQRDIPLSGVGFRELPFKREVKSMNLKFGVGSVKFGAIKPGKLNPGKLNAGKFTNRL